MKIYFEKIKWAWIWVLGTLNGKDAFLWFVVHKNDLLREKRKSENYFFG